MQNTTTSPTNAPPVLDAERLHVYAVALELHAAASAVTPPLSRIVRDQLERASLSVVLNIAEGAGRHSRRQKRYHYAVARGSAAECAAITDVLRLQASVDARTTSQIRGLAVRCVQMLSKLEQALRA